MVKRSRFAALVAMLPRLSLLVVLSIGVSSAHAKLYVVSTTPVLAALASAVGGEHVAVSSLTKGSSDPHFATAKPSMIKRIFRADLLLLVGADLEVGWLPAALRAGRNREVLPGAVGYLDLSSVVSLLGQHDGPVSRARGDVHAKGNPHYWLDPENGARMARAIGVRLEKLDPKNRTFYRNRVRKFEADLAVASERWRGRLKSMVGRPVIAYHSSLEYLARAFGFRVLGQVEPLPGIAPNAASLAGLVRLIETEKIEMLLIEPFYERRSARLLQERTGIAVAIVPPAVGASPSIKTYFDLFEAIVISLLKPVGV